MEKPAIAVVMGGESAEREISLQTGEGVLHALQSLGYPAARLDFGPSFLDDVRGLRPAAVFNALHGGAGEDGTVQAMLDWLGIGYQGSGVRASAVAMDKWLTKALLSAESIAAPRGIRLGAREAMTFGVAEDFGLPCVVKPRAQGSAVGVTIVREAREWPDAVRAGSIGSGDLLVEEYIEGREFTVAILTDEALPIVEITPHDSFYSYRAKYTPGGSTHTVPAPLDSRLTVRIKNAGLALHRALGCRDYSRVDILLDRSGGVFVLECNTLPGLTPLSLFPDAAKAAGISYENLIARLVQGALKRTHSVEV